MSYEYTIKPKPLHPKVSILMQLKEAWNTRPINFKKIEILKKHLNERFPKAKRDGLVNCGVFGKHSEAELVTYWRTVNGY